MSTGCPADIDSPFLGILGKSNVGTRIGRVTVVVTLKYPFQPILGVGRSGSIAAEPKLNAGTVNSTLIDTAITYLDVGVRIVKAGVVVIGAYGWCQGQRIADSNGSGSRVGSTAGITAG